MPFRPTNKSKTPPPEETFEEVAYLKALGEQQKHVCIKLQGGEVVRGWIEYYDRNMLRLTREGAPNLFIFKSEIMYVEEGDGKPAPRPRRAKAAPLKADAIKADAAPLRPEGSGGK
jgi:host factor-I protein